MRSRNHRDGPVALHANVADREAESSAAVAQFVLEVMPRGAADARDDPDAQRHRTQPVALVAVEVTTRHQPAKNLITLLGEVTEREARIDATHLQRQPPSGSVEVEVAVNAHLHPVAEDEPVPVEDAAQPLALGGEEGHLDDGFGLGLVVGEREVGVGTSRTPALDLAAHPHPVVEPSTQPPVDHLGKLADGERPLGLEVVGRDVVQR